MIEIKMVIFLGKSNGIDIAIFEASLNSDTVSP